MITQCIFVGFQVKFYVISLHHNNIIFYFFLNFFVCMQILFLALFFIIIGASRSEPHTSQFNRDFFRLYVSVVRRSVNALPLI